MFSIHSYTVALLLMIFTMLCWGSWSSVLKVVGSWRFELLYYDYSLGILLTSIVAGFTLGTFGHDGQPFLQNLHRAGGTNLLFGFLGGVVFNLANMLLVAALAVAGLGVAIPIGIGFALVIGVAANYLINPQGSPALLTTGVLLVAAAIVVDGLAYRIHSAKLSSVDASVEKYNPRTVAKGIALSVVAGILMGTFFPLVEIGKRGPQGLGPYAILFVFAIGVFSSTFLFNAYFLKRPVQGQPLTFSAYFLGNAKEHIWGVLGGAIWTSGTLASFVVASAPKSLQVGPAISYALGQGATMIAAIWGVFVWKEFQGAGSRVKLYLTLMFLFFLTGLACISIAPLFAHR